MRKLCAPALLLWCICLAIVDKLMCYYNYWSPVVDGPVLLSCVAFVFFFFFVQIFRTVFKRRKLYPPKSRWILTSTNTLKRCYVERNHPRGFPKYPKLKFWGVNRIFNPERRNSFSYNFNKKLTSRWDRRTLPPEPDVIVVTLFHPYTQFTRNVRLYHRR